jgi:hypothetical protein
MKNILNFAALVFLFLGGLFLIRSQVHAEMISEFECMVYPNDDDYVDPKLDNFTKFRKHRQHAKMFFVLAEETAWCEGSVVG